MIAAVWFSNPPPALALEFLEPPVFNRANDAPLSGLLQFSTDLPTRVSVTVEDGFGEWTRHFYAYETDHSVPLFGFKPDRTNHIAVTVHGLDQEALTAAEPLRFVTDPLPIEFPNITVHKADQERMEPGYTLFRLDVQFVAHVYAVILDSHGEVVWYHETPSTADVRQLENGNLFMPALSSFVEMNLLGEVVNEWVPPAHLPIDPHDGMVTPRGTILYLAHATNSVPDYPTSVTNPDAPVRRANVYYQKLVEMSLDTSEVLHVWDPLYVLDPWRISYLHGQISRGWDAHHSNAIIEDPADGGLVVSMRHQHAVVKFDREGGIRWILGPHENWGPEWQPYLLTPVGTPFEWQYAQHAPVPTPEGTWVVYDNGNDRALPFAERLPAAQNYTRAVEYLINEETMEVRQVWEYGKDNAQQRIYTPFKGNAQPLPETGNVLIGFSAVTHVDGVPPSPAHPNATMVRIQEVTRDLESEVVFDAALTMYDREGSDHRSCTIYRALRIPDLYGHPPIPVEHLAVSQVPEGWRLEFSADPIRTYLIEASDDLEAWFELGEPFEDDSNSGDFNFVDLDPGGAATRYYRVVTH